MDYPWRCLCFAILQTQYKRFLRRTSLQFLHMGLTDACTFILQKKILLTSRYQRGLVTIHDAPSSFIRGKLQGNLVSHHHFDVSQTHAPSQVGQHNSAVLKLNTKRRVGQCLYDTSNDFLLFLVDQGCCTLALRMPQAQLTKPIYTSRQSFGCQRPL